MLERLCKSNQSLIGLRLSGTLDDGDNEWLIPRLKATVDMFGYTNILIEINDFHGSKLKTVWDDIKLGLKYKDKVNRVAIVGDNKWEKVATKVSNTIMRPNIEYFEKTDIEFAWRWLQFAA